ncbi:hypothetical protein I3843_01G186900 [Carya illinoinensis]|nr:nucleolin 2 [Carya illinoinensis]KAG2728138.1 hypothetical protein I3760_01G191300 [Carya illinoinensis]KAG2728139.1 hypothetical protein I3760_01G191300 [Carya illinoinensis]KAG2728140.1 hypothetical protein I3760_01G191300 [Carya illinoinensis]KAG6621492.1 hypothetical protein I3842_Q023900 [Carya illinoinensis]KAG6621493.1 hypothetical protein I3842_Q023900 [Carya illinoinensis]
MGNEMGNNNTSGLKEENNTNAIDSKNLLLEADGAEDVKVENQTVPTSPAKDFYEKVAGLSSDDPTGPKDPHIENETSGGREQEENEVLPHTELSKTVTKSIDPSGEDSEFRPTSSQKNSEVHEKTIEPNLDDNQLVTSDIQLQKQAFPNEEQEKSVVQTPTESLRSVVDSIEASGEDGEIKPASPNDSEVHEKPSDSYLAENLLGTYDHQLERQASTCEEPRRSSDLKSEQHELDQVNANLSEEDGSRLLQASEDILGPSEKYANEENGHLLNADISNNLGVSSSAENKSDSLVKEATFNEEKLPYEEKNEIINGNGVRFDLSNLKTTTSDPPGNITNNCNGELSTEADSIRNDSLNSELENVVLDKLLNSHQEVSEPEDKWMILTRETKIVGSGSEIGEVSHESNLGTLCENPEKELKTDETNDTQSESRKIESKNEECEMRSPLDISTDISSIIEEEKTAENAYNVEVVVRNQNSIFEGRHKDSEGELLVVSEELVPVPAELIFTDRRSEEEQPEEKKILEKIDDKAEASFATVKDTFESETAKQCMSQAPLIDQEEAFLLQSPAFTIQSLDHNWPSTVAPETTQSTYEPNPELRQEICNELFVAHFSTFNSTRLTAENFVSAFEESCRELSQCEETTPETLTETTTLASLSSAQGIKTEGSALVNGSTGGRESGGRLSTESNPDYMNAPHVQMRKSPSFDLDLRIDQARGEESDQTPLLFQEKDTKESSSSQADVNLGNSVEYVGYNKDLLQYQSMAVEEKVIKLERSESEKSRTPFLGFLKEEEKAQIVVTPQKQVDLTAAENATRELCDSSTKEAASASTLRKGKEKRKPRSSFFGNCVCCATAIN